jgi:hypothetical protein
MIRATVGQITGVPLKLSLVPQRTISYERGGPVTVHVLELALAKDLNIYQLAAGVRDHSIGILPPPEEAPPDDYLPDEEGIIDPVTPPVEQWTPQKDLAEAAAPDAAAPPAPESSPPPEPAPPPAARGKAPPEPRLSRPNPPQSAAPPVDPVAEGLGPQELEQLKKDRQALAQLIREIVPPEKFNDLPTELAQWFGGKSRIVLLDPDELRRAGALFREKYAPAPNGPPEPLAPSAESSDEHTRRRDLWQAIRAGALADQGAKFALHQALAQDLPGFTAAQFESDAPPEALTTAALQTARDLVT